MKHDMYLSHIREYAPDVDYMDTRHMHHTLDSVPHKETDTTSKHVWNSRTDTFRSRSMYMTPAELWLKIQGDKRTPANHEPIPFQLPRPRTIPGNATDKHRRLAAALWDMFHPGQPQQRAKKATKIRTITRSVIHTRTLPPTPITIDYGDLSPTTPKDAQWVDISSDDDVVIVSETPAPAVAITSRLESTVTISSASPSAYSSNYPVTPGLTPGAAHKTYPAITYPVPHIVALPTPPANHLKRTHTGHPKTQTEIIVIDSDSDNDQDNISNVADIDDNAPSSDSAPDSSSNDDGGDDDVVMEKAGKLMRGFERLKNIWTPHKDKKARVDDGETEMEDGHSMEDGAAGIGEWVSGVVGEGK
ncbi:uncharacterized protein EV422DRAFT_520426 [Fimicolochytrium jonesii]|uniref:uncharacterized protein n=1 Tax=Fimicolochytrium jonesii TaxID=1396493 RepID=UPI0022FEBC96|nr:uncharacterized protein EV422DRAFT_520426 [Fimicolochytrium jonesii]KAI8824533.1 hypothetical protein EV422DRAFT_520426 [Fimicolochytrium jonesii]